MRILQIIQKSQLRGAELFACQLSNHLLANGNDVIIIGLLEGDAVLPFNGRLICLGRNPGLRLFDLTGWYRLARIIKDFKPDIVQANAGDTLKFAVFSKIFFRWKTPLIFRNANKVSDFIDSWTKRLFNRFLTGRLDYVISVSELSKNDFKETYDFPDSRIDTVQVGIELADVVSPPSDLGHLFSQGPVLVNVASFVKEKNHYGLFVIFQALLKTIPTARLLLVGRGKLEHGLKESTVQLGINGRVHFLGYRNDVLAIMRASHVFVLPSHIEGLPAVILEAQYSRVPVVAYNVGGISEIVQNGRTGWLVEKDDVEQFVSAVVDVLQGDRGKVKDIVNNARQQVVDQYDNRKIAERFTSVYQRVIRTVRCE